MGLTVTFENKEYPDGFEFGVEGLGLFKNGEAREISEEEEKTYFAATGYSVKTGFSNSANVKVEGEGTVSDPEPQEDQPGQPGQEEEGQTTEETQSDEEKEESNTEESQS
jgi:hypothetical protein